MMDEKGGYLSTQEIVDLGNPWPHLVHLANMIRDGFLTIEDITDEDLDNDTPVDNVG